MSMGVFVLWLENTNARIYYDSCFSRGVANHIASCGLAIKHCAWRISWAVLRNILLHLILSPKNIHGHICNELLHFFLAILIGKQRNVCRRISLEALQITLWNLILWVREIHARAFREVLQTISCFCCRIWKYYFHLLHERWCKVCRSIWSLTEEGSWPYSLTGVFDGHASWQTIVCYVFEIFLCVNKDFGQRRKQCRPLRRIWHAGSNSRTFCLVAGDSVLSRKESRLLVNSLYCQKRNCSR